MDAATAADFSRATGLLAGLDLLDIRLNRPAKRNALSDRLIGQWHTALINVPEGGFHSRMWHAALDAIPSGRVPVVAVARCGFHAR